ncbi:MAG: 30S ribosomal protein S9 [Candidatus Parcubacteria bacterium]|nr:30S ribosomal protein S9 [Candidatus Parcubacteria bacterium]
MPKKIVLPVKKVVDEIEEKPSRYFEAVGRRKTSVARVRLFPHSKGLTVNDLTLNKYFSLKNLQDTVLSPFVKTQTENQFQTSIKVKGGGINGQADAIKLGISRALVVSDPNLRKILKTYGYLTRDARKVERKKYGLKKARRAPQWQKR